MIWLPIHFTMNRLRRSPEPSHSFRSSYQNIAFYEISDIENYLQLLTKTPEYFRSILNFEHIKSESGLFMASYTADSIIKECRDFVNLKESNYLYSSFVERLEELASAKDGILTEKQRETYTRQNNVYIKKYIFPAYEQLISGLSELRSSGKNNNGLCYLPNGRTYYEYLVRSETGSSRSIAELQNSCKYTDTFGSYSYATGAD